MASNFFDLMEARQKFLDSLACRTFTGDFFLTNRGCCVYAWIRGDEWLYVGKTANGLNRIFMHETIGKCEPILPDDEFRIVQCDDMDHATTLEAEFIIHYKPIYNVQGCKANGNGITRRIKQMAANE